MKYNTGQLGEILETETVTQALSLAESEAAFKRMSYLLSMACSSLMLKMLRELNMLLICFANALPPPEDSLTEFQCRGTDLKVGAWMELTAFFSWLSRNKFIDPPSPLFHKSDSRH